MSTLVSLEAINRPTKDIINAAKTLDGDEIRYLVDSYYQAQEMRKGVNNQIGALRRGTDEGGTEHQTLTWLAAQFETIEKQVARALDVWTMDSEIGQWVRSIHGIGPVLSAGLLAHIDIEKAPTVGHIWRFAGLDPTTKWEKGEKRPFNAGLKTLCWKVGQSFMKFSNQEECVYGHIYRERKAYEIERNDRGDNDEAAKVGLTRVGKGTDAYKHYSAGRLPPAQIDARARRYAVKLFLSHLHGKWHQFHFGRPAPLPYPIAILGHAHFREAA